MSETKTQLSPIEQGAKDYFGSLPKPESERRADLANLDKEVVKASLSDGDVDMLLADRSAGRARPDRRKMSLGRRVLAGAAATAAVLGVADRVGNDSPEPETATYVVGTDPSIDTAWEMAHSIEAKTDGVAGNEDIRPIVDDLMEQAKTDGEPGLQPGEHLQVPADADRHQDPGIQLSSK